MLKLWEYYGALPHKKWKALPSSAQYWLLVIGMLLASGFFSWVICEQSPSSTAIQVATAGIAARSLIRQFLAAKTSNRSTKLGDEDTLTMSDLLR